MDTQIEEIHVYVRLSEIRRLADQGSLGGWCAKESLNKLMNGVNSHYIINMYLRHRVRMYPNVEQAALLTQWSGHGRFLWNLARDQRRWFPRRGISKISQCLELTDLRRELPWLAELPAQTAQQILTDLDLAYQRHWVGLANYPIAKRKYDKAGLRFPQKVKTCRLNRRWGLVWVSNKLGWVRFRWSRNLDGRLCSASINVQAGHWYVSFNLESPQQPASCNGGLAVGVDRGVEIAFALSDGSLLDREMWTLGERRRLLHLERLKACQEKDSKRYGRTILSIAKLHQRATHRRHDFAHKVSTLLAKKYGLVALEDLAVPNMTRSAKGTVGSPGENVAQKAGLNRAILDKGWGLLSQNLRYKTEWYGSQLVEVPAHFTSLQCPNPSCGHTSQANRPFRAVFICERCGYKDHADSAAATNIRERGIKLALTGGQPGIGRKASKRLRTWRQPTWVPVMRLRPREIFGSKTEEDVKTWVVGRRWPLQHVRSASPRMFIFGVDKRE